MAIRFKRDNACEAAAMAEARGACFTQLFECYLANYEADHNNAACTRDGIVPSAGRW